MKTNSTKHLLALAIITGTLLSSCNKDDDPKKPTEASGIYATYSYGSQHRNRTAILWKDGVETDLTNYEPTDTTQTKTTLYTGAVWVGSNGDIYISGCECYQHSGAVMYYGSCYTVFWKNGIKQNLNSSPIKRWYINSSGTDIQITEDGDVYVLGRNPINSTDAEYAVWKNNTRIYLLEEANTVSDMFVKGNDVYITGSNYNYSVGDYYPVLWKNGVEQSLPSDAYTATSVFVSENNDVYVGLHNGKVLKNNAEYILNASGSDGIYDIAASGTDMFFLGTFEYGKKAGIWKNGTLIQELEFDKTIDNIEPGSLFIKGEDIYAIGVVYHAGGSSSAGLNTVVIWKNGAVYQKLKELDGLTVEAPSIFVK